MEPAVTQNYVASVTNKQFGIINVLQRSPIPQTSNWSGTLFCRFLQQTGSKAVTLVITMSASVESSDSTGNWKIVKQWDNFRILNATFEMSWRSAIFQTRIRYLFWSQFNFLNAMHYSTTVLRRSKVCPIENNTNLNSIFCLIKSSKIALIFLPAFYLNIWLMTGPKNFEKIAILKIWELVS